MSSTILHLRSETKPFERRSLLSPSTTKVLIDASYIVNVEHSTLRCFEDHEFSHVGANLVPEGSWTTAPSNHIILGLKELLVEPTPLRHAHVHFAHVFKDQPGWEEVLARFEQGNGTLLGIEILKDDAGRLLAPSGFHAGYCGAAMAIKAWGHQITHEPNVPLPRAADYPNDEYMLSEIRASLAAGSMVAGQHPRVVVVGASGRCGQGAVLLCRKSGIPEGNILQWGRAQTARGGPFPEILESDILVNCIYLNGVVPPVVNEESLGWSTRRLRIISDVSCDNTDVNNPIAICSDHTTFEEPCLRVKTSCGPPLDVIAIDHLPSLLPREASEACSKELLPSLPHLSDWKNAASWKMALDIFHEKVVEAAEYRRPSVEFMPSTAVDKGFASAVETAGLAGDAVPRSAAIASVPGIGSLKQAIRVAVEFGCDASGAGFMAHGKEVGWISISYQ